jgi:hypothetical protein
MTLHTVESAKQCTSYVREYFECRCAEFSRESLHGSTCCNGDSSGSTKHFYKCQDDVTGVPPEIPIIQIPLVKQNICTRPVYVLQICTVTLLWSMTGNRIYCTLIHTSREYRAIVNSLQQVLLFSLLCLHWCSGNGFHRRTRPLLWVPELTPASATSF